MIAGKAGISLIEQFEDFRSRPYRCPAGIPTIGSGVTVYPDGRKVTMADKPITVQQAREMLLAVLARYEDGMTRYLQLPVTQNQFDALVAWAYNVGLEAARTSTLLRLLNAGDYAGAAGQFARWNRANGQVLAGLTRRRAAERALFLADEEVPA